MRSGRKGATMKWSPGNVSKYRLLKLWQQKYYDQQKSSISFLETKLTWESTVFFYLYFHPKKVVKIKTVWSKHFNYLSLLFFQCSENSQQKVFWKAGVLIFFPRNSWKAPANNFPFSYYWKLDGYTFATKVIKITSSYQIFQPDPQLATMQSYYFKKHDFFQYSLSSCFCRLYSSTFLHWVRSNVRHVLENIRRYRAEHLVY